jgi:hypothetical protein
MGVATKYGIKTIQFAEAGPDDRLLPVEIEFYRQLTAKVFVSRPPGEEGTSEIWDSISDFWESACGDLTQSRDFLHEQYIGVSTIESRIVNDKKAEQFHISGGLAFRSTLSVRISGRRCALVGNAAFAIFDYVWEFTNPGSDFFQREDGMYSQTWVQSAKRWKLLGMSGGPLTETVSDRRSQPR